MHTRGIDCDHIVDGGGVVTFTCIRHRLGCTCTFPILTGKVGVRYQDAANKFSTFLNEGFANGASLQFSQFSFPVAESFRIARRQPRMTE